MCVRLNQCCFCVSLRTGCLIIGYLSIVNNLINIIREVSMATDQEYTREGVEGGTFLPIYIMLRIIEIGLSIVLIRGVYTTKPSYLMTYFYSEMVRLVLIIILLLLGFVFTDGVEEMLFLLELVLTVYIIWVVRSAFLQMQEEQNPQSAVAFAV